MAIIINNMIENERKYFSSTIIGIINKKVQRPGFQNHELYLLFQIFQYFTGHDKNNKFKKLLLMNALSFVKNQISLKFFSSEIL